jgi:hypothetical protein
LTLATILEIYEGEGEEDAKGEVIN